MNENESVIVVSSKKELISQGYLYTNVNKEFMYEGNLFLLKQHDKVRVLSTSTGQRIGAVVEKGRKGPPEDKMRRVTWQR